MSDTLLPYKSYSEKRQLLFDKKLLLVDNVQYFLGAIEREKDLNAFLSVFNEDALKQAAAVQHKIDNGTAGKLAGMVIGIKDVLSIEGQIMTCASKILENFVPLYTATAVQKLIDEDAIIIGKTNCDEFAMGSSNENSAYGAAKNPHDKTRVPGGSSGGSAVAVAAGLCDVALGTDTGGSIRQPASFCGIFGLKPTYSLVSRYGLTAFASSFDSIGPFAHNMEDAAAVLQIIAGHDEKDSTSANREVPDYISAMNSKTAPLTIGLPKECFGDGLNPEIAAAIDAYIQKLKSAGFAVKEISLPHTEHAIATYYILTTAEASSNLARYDGARYGYRSPEHATLADMYKNSRSEGFGDEVKRRIMLGTYVLSAGYYDAYYKKAQQVRRIIKSDFDKAFNEVDIIITPTAPTTAFKIGEKSTDPLEMYLGDIYTTSANLVGIPGLNIPVGKDSNNMPIGMQVMTNQFEEEKLLVAGKFIESLF